MELTVRDIAVVAARLVQADDALDAIISCEDEDGLDGDAKTLLSGVELAAAELSHDGFPVLVTESIAASDGKIAYSAFSEPPSLVKSVRLFGKQTAFTLGDDGIKVARDGVYDITYATVPAHAGIGEEVRLNARCDVYTAAYLSARNYCLMTGRNEDAAVWDQRYNAEAEKRRISRRARLPVRRWR